MDSFKDSYKLILFTFQSDFLEHIKEYSLSASAKTAHPVTDQEIQETDYVIESTTVVYRRQEIQPLQSVAQAIEAGDL